jgi:3-dehydroquinate synthase
VMRIDIDFKPKTTQNYSIFIDEFKRLEIDAKVAIVTNPKVAGLHLGNLLNKIDTKELYIITVPDGEEYKNQDTVDHILESLFNHRLDRDSVLVAFGGGVIGDMTGYVASIYQRGVKFIQIPTTLLAQVDASVGGKTGINNKFGKNLIGAFHQPIGVYIETEFLKSLPKREFSAGVAEIVKMAVTFDKEFFNSLEESDLREDIDSLKEAIKRSIEIKADVVAKDEMERGVRSVLNYGHTFAHVIENETSYKRYLHGEAVAIGIVMANELAVKLSLLDRDSADRIRALLQRYDLPTTYEIEDVKAFYNAFFLDKKSQNDKIKFILPKGIGGYEILDDIDRDTVISVLSRFHRVEGEK